MAESNQCWPSTTGSFNELLTGKITPKYPIPDLFEKPFLYLRFQHMKLSNRDILLFLGIVVAVVITFTTLVHREHEPAAKVKKEISLPKKTAHSPKAS